MSSPLHITLGLAGSLRHRPTSCRMGTLPVTSSSLAATVGACYVGTILASILYGITSIQTLTFFRFYPDDPRWLRITVGFLWVLDTLHLAFIGHAVYIYVITDFGNMQAIDQPLWSMTAHVLLSNLSDFLVRGVFSYRIWRVSVHYRVWRVVTIGATSLVVFGSACAFSAWGFTSAEYVFEQRELSIFIYTNLALSMVADVLIAVFFSSILQRRRTGMPTTEYIIDYLMIYSISTGLLTTLCTLLCVLLYALLPVPMKFAFVAIYFILPKLLLNSLLATLNIRKCTSATSPSECAATTATRREPRAANSPSTAGLGCMHRRRERASFFDAVSRSGRVICITVERDVEKVADYPHQDPVRTARRYERLALIRH
ncbi:uncharacterized protein B0H18DRAFT_464956 [Fomitopsis serialis]|uniref:uncharacterized protein n=1 Tax=Fomitopsis serialis TaxID=139415 RepID=UPI002007F29A|nr:uncharacterized protein B0H18DRAFT_464956 [Neoantrodia serialis]KAH9923528.1 hypothetical protein B0H18DRAFT_464956 [Neoantrodia serialis]